MAAALLTVYLIRVVKLKLSKLLQCLAKLSDERAHQLTIYLEVRGAVRVQKQLVHLEYAARCACNYNQPEKRVRYFANTDLARKSILWQDKVERAIDLNNKNV